MSHRLPITVPGEPAAAVERPVVRHLDDQSEATHDWLAVEEPLEIRLGEHSLAITMRTPGNDLDLAVGFCWTEGILQASDELLAVQLLQFDGLENVVRVDLTAAAGSRTVEIARASRELYLSSSCGLCGKQSLDRIAQQFAPTTELYPISRAELSTWPARMQAVQATFAQTGGLHAAALFRPTGELLALREDVGRHNAVDKVIGACVRSRLLPLGPAVLLVSGRTSFELLQKAALAGIGCLAGVSAPSSLAVDFAERFGMTLVGFLRPGRMNVYHDPGRLRE